MISVYNIRTSGAIQGSVLFLLSFFLYFHTLGFDFTFDDNVQIRINEYVNSPDSSLKGILAVFSKATPPGDLYRPLVTLSFRLQALLIDSSPWHFHLVNILIYGSVTVLVFLLILTFSKHNLSAFIAAFIFALMPVHVEPVANVYGRTELMSAFFGILAILTFYRAIIENRRILSIFAGLLLFLAVLCKESALTVCFLAPLYVYYAENIPIKKLLKSTVPLIFFAAIYLLIRAVVLSDNFLIQTPVKDAFYQENPLFNYSFPSRIWPTFYILGQYLHMMILPGRLSADYSFPEKEIINKIYGIEGISYGIAAVIGVILIVALYRQRKFFFWGLWSLIAFSLTLNLLIPIGTFYADRLTFLPSIGIAAVLSSLFIKGWEHQDSRRKYLFALLLASYLFINGAKAITRSFVWENNLILFDNTVIDNPYSSKAMLARGTTYYEAGNFKLAAESYKEALFRDPSYIIAGKQLVFAYFLDKDFPRALYWSTKYRQIDPDNKEVNEIYNALNQLRKK